MVIIAQKKRLVDCAYSELDTSSLQQLALEILDLLPKTEKKYKVRTTEWKVKTVLKEIRLAEKEIKEERQVLKAQEGKEREKHHHKNKSFGSFLHHREKNIRKTIHSEIVYLL